MAIKKLKSLHQFLVNQNLVDQNKIMSWAEDAIANPTSALNNNGIDVCRFEYTGVVSIDGYSGDADLLLALISVWLMDNDKSRYRDELNPPNIDLDILDDDLADVDISIQFIETITMFESLDGNINFDGRTWSLGEPDVYVADSIAQSIDADSEFIPESNAG